MRTSSGRIASSWLTAAAALFASAGIVLAFDGTTPGQPQPGPALPVAAGAPGIALKNAVPQTSAQQLTALQYAAEGGHPVAQWKLGRMYAVGDGVTQNDLRLRIL